MSREVEGSSHLGYQFRLQPWSGRFFSTITSRCGANADCSSQLRGDILIRVPMTRIEV